MEHSLGSFTHPIVISDDDDEAAVAMMCQIEHQDADLRNVRQGGLEIPATQNATHKRKREPDTQPNSKKQSKKAKKRRKLERLAYEASLAQQQRDSLPYAQPHTSPILDRQQPIHRPYQQEPIVVEDDSSPPPDDAFAGGPISSDSAWVNSMAMAAPQTPQMEQAEEITPLPLPPPAHALLPPLQYRSVPPQPVAVPPPIPSNAPLVNRNGSVSKPHDQPDSKPDKPTAAKASSHLPAKPHPPQSIGILPDNDPNSKHGVFYTSSNPAPEWGRHVPNPARTLVLEQLPKTHRSADFINSWSRSACGALPVHVEVDKKGGKALVEFSTAELARSAWGSPRLGPPVAGQIPKKKPRLDLIRVWWYRVEGVGAGSGVGEIEEGEIEGDAAETPVMKESKKQRKARLAKERAEMFKHHPPPPRAPAKVAQPPPPPIPPPAPPPPQYYEPGPYPSMPSTGFFPPHGLFPAPPPAGPAFHTPPVHAYTTLGSPSSWPSYLHAAPIPSSQYANPPPNQPSSSTTYQTNNADYASMSSRSSIASTPSPPPTASDFGYHEQDGGVQDMDVDEGAYLKTPVMEVPPPFNGLPPKPPPETWQNVSRNRPIPTAPRAHLANNNNTAGVPTAPRAHLVQPASSATLPISAPIPRSAEVVQTPLSTLPSLATRLSDMLPGPTPSPTSASTPVIPAPASVVLLATAPNNAQAATKPKPAVDLEARQKELAQRIARSKAELELRREAQQHLRSPAVRAVEPPVAADVTEKSNQQTMEERLRNLVVASKLKKSNTTAVPPTIPSQPAQVPHPTVLPVRLTLARPPSPPKPTASSSSSSSSTISTGPPTGTTDNSASPMLDLAESFINDTISALKRTNSSTTISTSLTTNPPDKKQEQRPSTLTATTSIKADLAAKQKKLEQEIAERKMIMAKISNASTTQEKKALLALMREKERSRNEEANKQVSTPTMQSSQSVKVMASWSVTTFEYDGILEISDDEDDDE